MEQSFRDFMLALLSPAIDKRFTDKLLQDDPLDNYFRKAFTHSTFMPQIAAQAAVFNYEILEKLGDKVLGAVFQLYLYEIMGNEVTTPQPFADMDKYLMAKDELARLAEEIGLLKWIRIDKNAVLTVKIKSDLFEALVGAIVMASNRFITEAPSIGFVLAQSWLYSIFNTHMRHRIDPQNPSKYTDSRTQINEVWLFNGWGQPDYRTSNETRGAGNQRTAVEAAQALYGPDADNVPSKFRGKEIAVGTGSTLDEAKEIAAKNALTQLNVNFPEFKKMEFDVVLKYADLEAARLQKLMGNDNPLYNRLKAILEKRKDVYDSISLKKARVYRQFHAQLRVRLTDSEVWTNAERAFSLESEDVAIRMVFTKFIEKAEKGFIIGSRPESNE